MYLAFACAERHAEALRALDPMLRAAVERAVARIDPSPSFADEVTQAMREKLILSRPPKIADYAGRATLRSWLATGAVRTALNLRRRKGDAPSARAVLGSSDAPLQREPELEYLRERYKDQFANAVRDALAALPARERALLRLHLGERASVDKLAAIYHVGRSTAARWLAAARARLVEETRSRLCERLRLTDSEYRSLAALVRSDVEVSVVRLLEAT
jgi:RNA polymerase sigma-70 factor (ECF subfamily)